MQRYHVASSESMAYDSTKWSLNTLRCDLSRTRRKAKLTGNIKDSFEAKEHEIQKAISSISQYKLSELDSLEKKAKSDVASLLVSIE